MIKSMTGYGRMICELKEKQVSVEAKSLNSKQLDLNLRIPYSYKSKEMEIRSMISNKLSRGRIDFYMHVEGASETENISFNKELAHQYYRVFKAFAVETGEEKASVLETVLRMPEILAKENADVDEKEWVKVKKTIESALDELDSTRVSEGYALRNDFNQRISNILIFLKKVESFEKPRIDLIKKRLLNNLSEVIGQEKIDKNRFEQELIYYLEKFDINEEKVRLKKHCDFFFETLKEENSGKKIGFIVQEMGREINTMGSKANDVNIQKLVVLMKDELEKIKEQSLNVL